MTVVKKCADESCSVNLALNIIGEWWSIRIVRDLMLLGGRARFDELCNSLGIARNILTARLKTLTEAGVLRKEPLHEGSKRYQYCLTRKGWELTPIILTMMQWGDRWRDDPENISIKVCDQHSQPVAPLEVHDDQGQLLSPAELQVKFTEAGHTTFANLLAVRAAREAKD